MSNLARRLSGVISLDRPEDRSTPVPFAPWLPDLPALANPGALIAKNVIPAERSYRPFQDLVTQSDALNLRVRGAIAAKDTSGNAYHYAGTETKLYEVRNQSATDKSGATYSTVGTVNWEATLFGANVIFTNLADPVQYIVAGAGGNFADLFSSTNKPKGKHIGTVRQFLMLGNTNDTTDGVRTNRVWWSAAGDPTDMDPDSATQSDYEDLADGGAVQKVVGGADYGLIFQEEMIRRATYTAGAAIFDLSPIDRKRGTPIPGSVVGLGRLVFYISEEGFKVFTGTESLPIGANRFDRWFWDQFDIGNAHRVSSAIDFKNKLVVWAFPGSNSVAGQPNFLLIYNWKDDRAAYVEIDTEILVSALTQAYTLEDLDNINNDLDALTPSLDDPQWQGGSLNFAAYNEDHKLCYFTGDALEAIIDTGEFQAFSGKRAYCDFVRPLVDGGTVTVAVGERNLQTDTVSFGSDISATSIDGICPVDSAARYHRFRTTIAAAGSWTHAQGVEFIGRPDGVF